MNYENRLKHLEESHRMLDKKIDGFERSGIFDDMEIEKLKKQRLKLKDQMEELKRKHESS